MDSPQSWRCGGPGFHVHGQFQAQQVQHVEHLLELHRGLAFFDVQDQVVTGVAYAGQVDLAQAQSAALRAHDQPDVDRRADGTG